MTGKASFFHRLRPFRDFNLSSSRLRRCSVFHPPSLSLFLQHHLNYLKNPSFPASLLSAVSFLTPFATFTSVSLILLVRS